MSIQIQESSLGVFASGDLSKKKEVTTLTKLKSLRVNGLSTGDSVFVASEGSNYVWVSTSTLAIDDTRVLVPRSYASAKSPIGRWVIEGRPDVSSATLDTDEVSTLITLKMTKKSLLDLKKARVNSRVSGDGIRVSDLNQTFVWQQTSRLATNDTTVVLPNSYSKADFPVGRWVLEGVSLVTGAFPVEIETTTTQTPSITSLNNLILPIRSVDSTASPLAILDTDGVVHIDATAGNVDVSLPDTATIPAGRFFTIRKVDHSSNVVNISATGGVLIDTLPSIELNNIGGCSLISDGTHYFILP